MPPADRILALLTDAARSWQPLAAFWHLWFGAAAVALVFGVRLPARWCGLAVALPVLSVAIVAWSTGNLFNGVAFALVGVCGVGLAARATAAPVRLAPPWFRAAGALLFAFGWAYPHFLGSTSWVPYLHSAPVGVVPCPTLSIAIGLLLIVDGAGSRALPLTIGLVGAVYGTVGPLLLGVALDWALAAGALLLVLRVATAGSPAPAEAPTPARPASDAASVPRISILGVGPRLAGVLTTYAALALFVHFGTAHLVVFPWPSSAAFSAVGIALIAIGLLLWGLGARSIRRAYREARLLTTGPYALVRHPMYSAFLFFVPLGIALLLRSWAVLTVPVVASWAFAQVIRGEEEYLAGRFGQAWLEYRAKVGALVPFVGWP